MARGTDQRNAGLAAGPDVQKLYQRAQDAANDEGPLKAP
jgi:hypothetical protein